MLTRVTVQVLSIYEAYSFVDGLVEYPTHVGVEEAARSGISVRCCLVEALGLSEEHERILDWIIREALPKGKSLASGCDEEGDSTYVM